MDDHFFEELDVLGILHLRRKRRCAACDGEAQGCGHAQRPDLRPTTNKLRHSDSGNCWIARITAWWILWRFGWRRRTIKIPWCGTVSEFAEPLIRGDEKARFRSCYPPQFRI